MPGSLSGVGEVKWKLFQGLALFKKKKKLRPTANRSAEREREGGSLEGGEALESCGDF